MRYRDIPRVWRGVLSGRSPMLSIEITKECPLRCPGCYAFAPDHVGEGVMLRSLRDRKGGDLVDGVLAIVRRLRPVHLSIVGGEPLVRYRELDVLLPKVDRMGVEVQLVTSAVRRIPPAWASIPGLHLVVSVDGLPPEHDARRAPATYERILEHIRGHRLIVHCTITRQMLVRDGYLDEFAAFWSARPEVTKIWYSVYTPQEGEIAPERLGPEDRARLFDLLAAIPHRFPKVWLSGAVLEGFRNPPQSPDECVFSKLMTCYTADLATPVTPCQFGGRPVCAECGCIAAAGLSALGRHRVAGLIPVSRILDASLRAGARRTARRQPAAADAA